MSIAAADTQALEVKSADLSQQLDALRIKNVREVGPAVLAVSLEGSALIARLADDYIREVRTGPPGTEGMGFDPLVRAAHESHKKLVAERDRLLAPAEMLKREAGLLGHACNAELKRREEEQRQAQDRERQRLQKIADDAAEAERQRLQKIADDERLAQAEQAEASGDHGMAAKLIEAPVVVPPVRAAAVFVPPPPRLTVDVKGQAYGETWGDYEVTEPKLIPREYWLLDDKKIRGVIRAMKASTNIPGIKVSDPRPKTTVRKMA